VNIQNCYCIFSENGTKENVRYIYLLKIFLYFMDLINISCTISLRSSQTLAGKFIGINYTGWAQSPSASIRRGILVRVDVTVNECTVLRQKCRVVGCWDYVQEVMYATKSVLHMGLPYFQKSVTLHRFRGNIIWSCKGKGTAVPLQAWSGPDGSRKLRLPDFMTTAQYVGKVVSLTHLPPLPPGNTPSTHFC
jgi:hypothetical protein